MFQILIFAVFFAFLIYYYTVKPMSYWKRKGVIQMKPYWLFGDCFDFICRIKSIPDSVQELYNMNLENRYFGIYMFTAPVLMVKDPDLIKQITIRDFDHFTDHPPFIPDNDPLWGRNLLALRGKKWHDTRSLMSRTFTSSKMRAMYTLMKESAQSFVKYFVSKSSDQDIIEFEARSILSRFSTDVIATTAFGFKSDSLEEPENEFYLAGKEVTSTSSLLSNLKIVAFMLVPKLYKWLNIPFFGTEVRKYFLNIIENNVKEREERRIVRPDLIHLLLEARKGLDTKEDINIVDTGFATVQDFYLGKGAHVDITNADIAAHALIFFIAGFDSTTVLMSFMMHELAVHPDVQNKLRKEIQETFDDCKGTLNYESLMKMKYLDMVVSETLRKWSNFPVTDRVCTKSYTIQPATPNENAFTVEPGTRIWLPIHSIHHDPKYFSDPERFDPERFSDENKENIKASTYFPFGIGPRNCIGSRFAILQTKIIFFYLLLNLQIVVTSKTRIPIVRAKNGIGFTAAEGGLHLGFRTLRK